MNKADWRDRMSRHPNAFRFYAILVDGQQIGRELARNEVEAIERYAEGSTYAKHRMTARPESEA